MASQRSRSIMSALVVAASGAACVAMAFLGLSRGLDRALAQLAAVIGASLVGGGIVWLAAVARRQEEAPVLVPAHVSFHQRTPRIETPPDAPMAAAAPFIPPSAKRATPVQGAPAAAAPAPKPAASAPVSRTSTLDEQIRELTRQISKAGVMLATGQLSQEGYRHYVSELKVRKGKLEAARIDQHFQV